jgi:catalase
MATSEDGRQEVEYGDQRVERGRGGETHQVAAEGAARLTTQQGTVVSDDQNTLRVGERGPDALEDFGFREKIFHFDHERIPERVVHARGYGAHGYFENYEPLTEITRADPFCEAGLRTPVFVRFSTVAGNQGSSDLARDVRGFATKFYTRQGNWDLVGNNIPVFFIQDAMKFPDLIHAAKAEPDRGFPQAQTAHDNFWDFVTLMPESAHGTATRPGPSGGCGRRASPTTTARPASSSSARPRSSGSTSSTRSSSS